MKNTALDNHTNDIGIVHHLMSTGGSVGHVAKETGFCPSYQQEYFIPNDP